MNTWLKNLIVTFFVIAAPGVVIDVVFYKEPNVILSSEGIAAAIGTYAITITGLVLFYRYRPCSMWVLPLSFALPVPICYMKDTLNINEFELFPYDNTAIVLFYYSLPMVLTTFYIAFVSATRGNMGRKRHFRQRK